MSFNSQKMFVHKKNDISNLKGTNCRKKIIIKIINTFLMLSYIFKYT
jgi:hypothetical protein